MLKQKFDKLRKKYGYSGDSLQELMTKVLEFNSEKISNKVAKITQSQMEGQIKKLGPAAKKMIMPELNEILPSRTIFARKAAEKGKLMTDTLREAITKDLRAVMTENNFIYTTGPLAGHVNRQVVKQFQERITGTFDGYVKRGVLGELPSNIKAIATTEVRSAVNETKFAYAKTLSDKNDLVTKKKWVHNRSLSGKPREEHVILGRKKAIGLDENFVLPITGGNMRFPHDPLAPPDQVINCNCDIEFISQTR